MKSAKFQEFIFSLLATASLFVSLISACACSHHQEKPAAENFSCHEHSPEAQAEMNHAGGSAKTINLSAAENGCVCVPATAKIFAKAGSVKFEKHSAAINLTAPPEFVFDAQKVSVKFDFVKPFYLSDSFYNLSPGRAPPVL